MKIFQTARKKELIPRLGIKDVVAAVFLMASRAKDAGCGVIFFPEAGGLPLKYIFEHSAAGKENHTAKIFSSKITASVKSSLSKQICAILSPRERNGYLTDKQLVDFKKAMAAMPGPSKDELKRVLGNIKLKKIKLQELISKISEIGLYVPGEDKSNWVKAGIIPETLDPSSYSPENIGFKKFQAFRKRTVLYNLERLPDIVHDARPLLNIILARTNFAKAVGQNSIYVMDEAVSRGRTLNALEIIFKSFSASVSWKIGVLFCPIDVAGNGNIDYILSSKYIPPFSNRFDLIGDIVVESDSAFVKYSIGKILAKKKKLISRPNEKLLAEYLKSIRQYARRRLSSFLRPGILDENDLIRLLHFIFVCRDMDVIKRCIDLNPMKISGLIEEASFYINMPHPFDPMPIRKSYKDGVLQVLEYLGTLPLESPIRKDLEKLRALFRFVRKDYELLELQSWSSHYRDNISRINTLIKA